MTHAFAMRLRTQFFEDEWKSDWGDKWHVDCEYNRYGDGPKTLPSLKCIHTNSHELDTPRVFPDIIIHKRGPDGPNLLVIEAKKSNAKPELVDFDRRKIIGYIEDTPLNFSYGVLLTFPCNGSGTINLEWWRRENGKAVRWRQSKI